MTRPSDLFLFLMCLQPWCQVVPLALNENPYKKGQLIGLTAGWKKVFSRSTFFSRKIRVYTHSRFALYVIADATEKLQGLAKALLAIFSGRAKHWKNKLSCQQTQEPVQKHPMQTGAPNTRLRQKQAQKSSVVFSNRLRVQFFRDGYGYTTAQSWAYKLIQTT